MKKDFLENIKSLIEMYYYTDNENLRFLAWIKAKRTPGIENIIDIFCYTETPKERCIAWKKALPISFDWEEIAREWYYIRKEKAKTK